MKRLVSLSLVVVLILGSVGLVACGGKESEPTQEPTQTPSPTTTPSPTQTAPSPTGGLTWNDMPIYSGAKQVQKGSWSIPPAEGDYSKVEWRYYESGDNIGNVASFYKGKMPGQGWEEMGWMETPEMNWGMYNKNNEQDAAMVWIGSDDGKTFIALMRASK